MRRASVGLSAILLAILMSASTALAASGDGPEIASTANHALSARDTGPSLPGAATPPQVAPPASALAPVPPITAIAAGDLHTCALTTGGGVMCWGNNSFGQLGTGSTTSSLFPVAVSGLYAGITAIAAGDRHTCALTSVGGVACWGQNLYGQLGNGTTNQSSVPLAVSGLTSGVTAIAASGGHTCALTSGGGVKCWGHNYVGQTGNGTESASLIPVDVSGLTGGFSAVSGSNHTCALTSSGGVKCWGYNYVGQLGNGATSTSFIPVDVSSLTGGVTAISAGTLHTCALTSGGGVKCWGYNVHGELGNGTRLNGSVPVDVSGLASGVSAIAAGGGHTCALTSSGGARCWGANYIGQLGNGATTNSLTAVGVYGLTTGIAAIATGRDHTCTLTTRGGVKCWGDNAEGRLGNGKRTSSRIPVDVDFARAANTTVAIAAGGWHTCSLTSAGGVKCWGHNYLGQLGNGTTTGSPTPVDVVGLASGVVAIAAGGSGTCALTIGGGVKCWGANYFGQLGNGTTTDSTVPVNVAGLSSGIRAISVADAHTCALSAAGTVRCWGYSQYGELGNGTPVRSHVSVPVVSGPAGGVSAISAGAWNTCALSTAGGVTCWGGNGTLGNATTQQSSVPVGVAGLASGVHAISTGLAQACALTDAGAVRCWGGNGHGELGNGSTGWAATPVQVSGLDSGVSAVTAGGAHTCAVTDAGVAYCWGDNHYGMLGDGTTIQRTVPVAVGGLPGGVLAVSAGFSHTCALLGGGRVMCWGHGNYGELGYGRTSNSAVPVDVDFTIHPTIVLRSSTPAGTIAQGTTVTFSATVRPLGPAGIQPTVRFAIYRWDGGVWRTAAWRDVTADATGHATLRWGFVTAGQRYVRAKVLPNATWAGSAWSPPVRYTVR